MIHDDLTFIRRLPLFRNMTTVCFGEIMQGLTEIETPANHVIVEQGAAADFLYIVVKGGVEMYASWGGARMHNGCGSTR